MDRKIKDFIWSGKEEHKRPRIRCATLLKPIDEGDLGLISIKAQTFAMVGKMMLKITQEGDSMLQAIYRKKLELCPKKGGEEMTTNG